MTSFDLTTWAAIIGTWVLVVGTLVFAYWQLKQAQRLNSSTTILDLRERYFSPRMQGARHRMASWLLQDDRSGDSEDWEVPIFFELMGFLTRTRVLELRMVWSAFGGWITAYYVGLTEPENLIEGWRKESGDPAILRDFEWLAKRILELDRRIAPAGAVGTDLTYAREILGYEAHNTARDGGSGRPP